MPTLEEEIAKRNIAESLQFPDQLPWEPITDESLQPPPDDSASHATEDTTRDQPEKPRTLDDSDIGSASPPPAKPEPLPPRKSALAEEAWTGKGSYWAPLASPENQAPAQDVLSPSGLDVGEAPSTLTQVERAELVKMPSQLSPEAQVAQDRGEMVVASPALPSGPLPPAPDALAQVERGELVTPTTPPAPAPGTLTQVERGQLVNVPQGTAPRAIGVAAPVPTPPAGLVPSAAAARKPIRTVNDESGNLPGSRDNPYFPDKGSNQAALVGPGEWYVDPKDGSMVQKPGAPSAPPTITTTQPAAQPAAGLKAPAGAAYKYVPIDPVTGKELPAPPAEKPVAAAANYTQPDGSAYPQRTQAVGGEDPKAFIVHNTEGRGTVDGVISTLRERRLGVEYVMDRDGKIYSTGGPGSQQILSGWGDKGTGLNNSNTVGMEIISLNDGDVTDAQKKSFAQFIQQRYPNTPLYGHGEVNPGHKADNEGLSAKQAALDLRASGGAAEAPAAQLATGKNGLYQNEKPEDFVTGRSSNFASQQDIASGQDSGVGSPKLGRLATSDVAGVAVPEWVLQSKFGNNPAAWRKARADVVGPDGRRLRLPIVDLGPGPGPDNAGVVVDMTPSVSKYFGGDGNVAVKLVANAGPDVNKNPQSWVDEQDAIKHGFDSASLTPGAVKKAPNLPYTLEPVNKDDQATTQQAQQADLDSQKKILADLTQQNPNAASMTRALSKPIPGISEGMRQEAAVKIKEELTKEAQSFYNEPDPDKAYAKAMSNAGPIELASDFWHKILAGAQAYQLPAAQAGEYGTAKNDINSFFGKAGITSDADKHAFLTKMAGMSHEERQKAITAILPPAIAGVTPDLGPSTNPEYLSRAFDKLFDPKFEQQQNQEIARVKKQVEENLRTDPRLKGTFGGDLSSAVGQSVADMATMATPALWPVFAAKISSQIHNQVKQDHPDWSEEQVQKASTYGTLVATLGQVGAQHVFGAIAEPLLKGIEAPVLRALSKIGIGGAGTAAVTGGGQAAVNIATGQPVWAGVVQAAVTGGMMGAAGAAMHGPGEGPRIEPEPPLEPHGPPAPHEVTPKDQDIHGPPAPPTRPVTGAEVLGQETGATTFTTAKGSTYVMHDDGTTTRNKAYRPEHGAAEVGPQPRSDSTIFVSPDDAQKLGEIQAQGGPKTALRQIGNTGQYGLQYLEGPDAGKFEKRTVVMPKSGPDVGLVPVEMWEGGSNIHFGNEITQVNVLPRQAPAPEMPWYKPGPIITRAQERTTFSPEELQQRVEQARQAGTPEQIQQAIRNLQPEPDWQRQNVYLRQDDPLSEPAPPEKQAVTGSATQRARVPEPPVPEATGTDKWVSGIANKFVEPRVEAGQIGEIAPGQGFSTKDLIKTGENMHPETVAQHVSDIMNGKTGSPEQAAAIRFKEAQLSERAAQASKIAAANPGNAEMQVQEAQAIQDVTDFHNGPVAKLKTSFHAQGMAMQREHPIDLTTYNGQLENWLRNSDGKSAPDNVKPILKQSAAKAKRVVDAATVAEKAFADEVGKPTKLKLPSDEELIQHVMETMGIGPCIVPG
jgi:hypothetical protein